MYLCLKPPWNAPQRHLKLPGALWLALETPSEAPQHPLKQSQTPRSKTCSSILLRSFQIIFENFIGDFLLELSWSAAKIPVQKARSVDFFHFSLFSILLRFDFVEPRMKIIYDGTYFFFLIKYFSCVANFINMILTLLVKKCISGR